MPIITEHKKSKLLYASPEPGAAIEYQIKEGSQKIDQELDIEEFIDVKGWRAMGNKVADQRLLTVKPLQKEQTATQQDSEKLHPGDTIDFDTEEDGQTKMFD